MMKIMEGHDIPYLATTSASFPIDLYDKFVKAKRIKGTRYLQIATPAPRLGFSPKDMVKIGRLAVETGIVALYEIEDGKFRFTGRSKTLAEKGIAPGDPFRREAGRFKKMSLEQLGQFQRSVDHKWNEYMRRAEA